MFRIRRIFDDIVPANQHALEQVRAMLRSQFELLDRRKIDRIPDTLRSPLKYGFRTILYVAEDQKSKVHGLALLDCDDELNFCYLDYLASDKGVAGRGIGAALYERIRNEALSLGVVGIFFECLSDDPKLSPDPAILRQNKARLRFYESYGARPIINTAYETPVHPGATDPPYLVFDDLSQQSVLRARDLKRVVAKILKSKYPVLCTPAYIKTVVDSIMDDPVRLRPPRYARKRRVNQTKTQGMAAFAKIALIMTDQHHIHHVRERGYVESPARIRLIRQALDSTGLFDPIPPASFGDAFIREVHDPAYVRYFRRVCANADPDTPFYPYVFPIRNRTRPPVELPIRAGYYCIDTFTPISGHAYKAARRAVDCALTAATEILSGRGLAYALVRPPGHHAEKGFFGGFCYFNNAAIATHFLSRFGKVAILDIDYHHGNGQQEIFYRRSDVLTISIHGHPRFAYPYFSGFSDERGEEAGTGFNVNYPLPESISPQDHMAALHSALNRIREFTPTYLVICLGLDTAKGDPTGTWRLTGSDFAAIGMKIGGLRLPTLVTQEGGYNSRSIGANARNFFQGFIMGQARPLNRRPI